MLETLNKLEIRLIYPIYKWVVRSYITLFCIIY